MLKRLKRRRRRSIEERARSNHVMKGDEPVFTMLSENEYKYQHDYLDEQGSAQPLPRTFEQSLAHARNKSRSLFFDGARWTTFTYRAPSKSNRQRVTWPRRPSR